MEGTKIELCMDHPIETEMLKLSEQMSSFLHNANVTPNMITTMGLLFGLMAVYFIWKGNKMLAFVFFWVGFFCDCLDGYYARKYDMMSTFGAYYDITRDWIVTSLLIIIIFIKIKNPELRVFYVVSTLVLFFLMGVHVGCQEKNTVPQKQSETLKLTKNLCPDKRYIYITRFFGCATFIFFQSLLIFLT